VTTGILIRVFVGIILLAAYPLWAQVAASGGAEAAATGPGGGGGAMTTPAPVSGEGYSMGFTSETRANYLRGGLMFISAYDSDATTGTNGQPIGDVSYSIWPTISLDQTRSRLHWVLSYAPGFTFYQKTSSLNQADQNLAVNLSYRLSPHVTMSLRDSFQKTSNVLNQPSSDLQQPVSGAVFVPNNSVIAPITDTLTNTANATLTYQFAANAMVGASGTFMNLYYPNQAQVPGLADSSSRGGSAFYTHRLSKMHYIGVTYQYQVFSASEALMQSESHTQSVFLFYSLYFKPTISLSLFGGPQYSNTQQSGVPSSEEWSPAGGASLGWQGKQTSFAASYSQTINGGGGLGGAVHANSVNASLRRQLTKSLSSGIGASYANNSILDTLASLNSGAGGHTFTGNASVQRQIGERLSLQLQYMRVQQSYAGISVISETPNRNRVAVTVSYQFSRPLGR
jgi:hypothetical protein